MLSIPERLPALKELIDSLIKIPRTEKVTYNQDHWFCGTAACLAGHFILRHPDEPLTLVKLEGSASLGIYFEGFDSIMAAQHYFGLNYAEATLIFGAGSGNKESLIKKSAFVQSILEDRNDQQ